MSLKFWLGGVGSDKSRALINYILDEADRHPDRQYLVVVPEQFGLATQRELVLNSANGGILNIDVLSFTRLAHRISDEVGSYRADVTMLDEMGKSLLIGMLANSMRDSLTVFSDSLDKPGYTDRLKSAVSEFMQYGISVEKTFEMAEAARSAGRILLSEKLCDIALIYKAFKDHIASRYTTVEEMLDTVSALIPHSDTIRNSEIIFDGFTGFTPVQNKLIGVIMEHAINVHVALLLEDCIHDNNGNDQIKEHELFYLSKSTMNHLGQMADERHIVIDDPYIADKININNACKLEGKIEYNNKQHPSKLNNTAVKLFAGSDQQEEITMVFTRIMDLVREKGYHYRDIAILTGDLESYRHHIQRQFTKHDIPFFIDRTRPVLLNPFIEYIRAFIDVIADNYSISSVFRYLKSGLTDISDDDVGRLENYCLALNIKGHKAWHERFDLHTKAAGANELLVLNEVREAFIAKTDLFTAKLSQIENGAGRPGEAGNNTDAADNSDARKPGDAGNPPDAADNSDAGKSGGAAVNAGSKFTVRQYATALYMLIVSDGIEEKLKEAAASFEEEGNREKSAEYGKIYAKIMDILDELVELIPDEKTDIRGFGNLLDAGLDAIRIGVIPTGMDYVQVGDLTRSRLGDIKALFIVGANDGVIPNVSQGGGIINENEKEFLESLDDKLVLAPTAKEDIYTQRLYIYMATGKPTELLYVSYARLSASGKSLLPSYLIAKLRSENENVRIERAPELPQYYTDEQEAFESLIDMMHPALYSILSPEGSDRVRTLTAYFLNKDAYRQRLERILRDLAGSSDEDTDTIGAALSDALYGARISANITRLESYAKCAYRYFLEYGLSLRERELFSFEAKDMGNIFHDSMKEYSELVRSSGNDWTSVDENTQNALMDKAVDKVLELYAKKKPSAPARYGYMSGRIRKIMRKSADVIGAQIRKGKFSPRFFEMDFDKAEITMDLHGRIDRIDTYEREDEVFVRIIDYKSSAHKVDLAAVFEGRQLQLLVYLNAAISAEKEADRQAGRTRRIIPAGVLYYRISDPLLTASGEISDEQIRDKIMKMLCLNGLVNKDDDIPTLMDEDIATNSSVTSLAVKKDGELKKSSQAVSGDDMDILRKYTDTRIHDMCLEIQSGNIAIPVPDNRTRFTESDCKYCPFTTICANKGRYVPEVDADGEDSGEEGLSSDGPDGEEGAASPASKMTNDDWIALMKEITDVHD